MTSHLSLAIFIFAHPFQKGGAVLLPQSRSTVEKAYAYQIEMSDPESLYEVDTGVAFGYPNYPLYVPSEDELPSDDDFKPVLPY